MSLVSTIKRRPLVALFTLIYAFTLIPGILLWKNAPPFFTPTFLMGAGIAALIVLAVTEGRAGLRDFGRRLILWRVAPQWYLVVIGLPILITAASVAISVYAGGAAPDWSKMLPPSQVAFLFVLFMLLPIAAPLPEEIAWRGVALPWLLKRSSPLTASLIVGVIWSLWHVTVLVADPVLRPPVPFLLAVPALSIIMTWVFVNTRQSLFIAILFHAWLDVVLQFAGALLPPESYPSVFWALAGVQWVLAIAIVALNPTAWLRQPDAAPAVVAPAR